MYMYDDDNVCVKMCEQHDFVFATECDCVYVWQCAIAWVCYGFQAAHQGSWESLVAGHGSRLFLAWPHGAHVQRIPKKKEEEPRR